MIVDDMTNYLMENIPLELQEREEFKPILRKMLQQMYGVVSRVAISRDANNAIDLPEADSLDARKFHMLIHSACLFAKMEEVVEYYFNSHDSFGKIIKENEEFYYCPELSLCYEDLTHINFEGVPLRLFMLLKNYEAVNEKEEKFLEYLDVLCFDPKKEYDGYPLQEKVKIDWLRMDICNTKNGYYLLKKGL